MSVHQIALVSEHVFSQPHQLIMRELAWFADDEGFSVRPSLEKVAYKTGYDVRHVRRLIRELESIGVLVLDRAATAQRPAEYHFNWAKVTRKPPYHEWLDGQRRERQARRAEARRPPANESADVCEAGHPEAKRPDTAMSGDPSERKSRKSERATHDARGRASSAALTHTQPAAAGHVGPERQLPAACACAPPAAATPFLFADFAPEPRPPASPPPADSTAAATGATRRKPAQKQVKKKHRVVNEGLTQFIAACMGGLRFRLKTLTRRDELANVAAAKRLAGKWTPEQVFEVYDALAADEWRRARITLQAVESEIGSYFYRKELRARGGGAHSEGRAAPGAASQNQARNYAQVYQRLSKGAGGTGK